MKPASKISACVDCSTPIIGELLRCFACHNRHAPPPLSRAQGLIAWLGAVLIIAATIVLLIISGRSCQ